MPGDFARGFAVDHDIDNLVARTRSRPLPSGRISRRNAKIFMVVQSLVGLAVLLCFNGFSIVLGILSLAIVAIYPFAKRFTDWPQFFLGLAFSWGGLMGWAGLTGTLSLASVLLYGGAVVWTIGYDTIYAHQDKEDDALVGVRSTARLFAENCVVCHGPAGGGDRAQGAPALNDAIWLYGSSREDVARQILDPAGQHPATLPADSQNGQLDQPVTHASKLNRRAARRACNQAMTDARQNKVLNIAVPDQDVCVGQPGGKLAVVGWGSTFGPIHRAVKVARSKGLDVSHIHVRHIWPLPGNLGDLLKSYDRVLVPEMNTGQFKTVLRDQYLVDAKPVNKVSGQPFTIAEIEAAIEEALA